MKRILAISSILLLAAGCGAKTGSAQSGAPLNVATAFAPDPPQQGNETITVTVTDSAGTPVKGAAVKIASSMPAMSMGGPTLSATDNGDGTYTAHAKLQATQWKFEVSAASGGKTANQELTVDVK